MAGFGNSWAAQTITLSNTIVNTQTVLDVQDRGDFSNYQYVRVMAYNFLYSGQVFQTWFDGFIENLTPTGATEGQFAIRVSGYNYDPFYGATFNYWKITLSGQPGTVGYTGSAGVGFTGSRGLVGYTGSIGDVGYTGSAGDVGFTGSAGDVGFTGSIGDVGYTGSAGAGYTGSQGLPGEYAALGYTGSQGVIGYTGSSGTLVGIPESVMSITNVQTLIGNVAQNSSTLGQDGGNVRITGTGFDASITVVFDGAVISSSSVYPLSSNLIHVNLGPKAAGSYTLQIISINGTSAIRPNAVTYEIGPIWITSAQLPTQLSNKAFTIQFQATGTSSYQLSIGSSLYSNISLNSSGLLSGNVSVSTNSNISFSVDAVSGGGLVSSKRFYLPVSPPVAPAVSWPLLYTSQQPGNENTFMVINTKTSSTAYRLQVTSTYINPSTLFGNLYVSPTGGKEVTTNKGQWERKTGASTAMGNAPILCAAYGNGLTVIGGWSARLATSTDLTNWTRRSLGTGFLISASINDIIYNNNPDMPLFVAAGTRAQISRSSTGITWTYAGGLYNHPRWGPSYDILTIAYGNEIFVAGGTGGKIAYSYNAINWIMIAIPNWSNSESIVKVIYNGQIFMAIGSNLSVSIASKDNLDEWVMQPSLRLFTKLSSVFGGAISIGTQIIVAATRDICTTLNNGTTWTVETFASSVRFPAAQTMVGPPSAEIQGMPNTSNWPNYLIFSAGITYYRRPT